MDEGTAPEALEHLQAAAREVIKAARAMLDVAENLVDDPDAVLAVVGEIGGVVTGALRTVGEWMPRPDGFGGGRGASGRSRGGDDGDDDDDGDDGRVHRIRVS